MQERTTPEWPLMMSGFHKWKTRRAFGAAGFG